MTTDAQACRFRKLAPGILWVVAALFGGAAWGLARYGIPLLLEHTTASRITPTLLQTLNLRVWAATFSAVFLAALALLRGMRPAWHPAPVRVGIGLIGLALLLRWVTPEMAFNSIVRPDGVHFSVTAQQLVSHGSLLVPTGSARIPARTLPGPSFLQALTQWSRPDHPGYGIGAVWLCAALSLWLALSLGRKLHGPAAGWWAILLLALSPAHGWYSRQLMSEIPWGLLILGSCGLLAGGIRNPSRAAMAGVLAGLGLLIKSSHLLILIGMLLGLAAVHFRRGPIRPATWLAFLGGMAVGSLPAFLYNRLVLGDWLKTAYHIYWPGWASATTALNIQYLWNPPLINGTMGNGPYYALALLGLDPRPERMILLPGVLLLLICLLVRGRRRGQVDHSMAAETFQHMAFGAAGLYGTACLLYSFQEPRFFLPIIPLVFVALAAPAARGWSTLPFARQAAAGLGPALLACLLGLGAAILTVETFSPRVPERCLLQQLARASAPYDILVSDEDPVLLTTFGVWTDHTRVWPLLLPGELWFPDDPARLFTEKGVVVEPFAGTVHRVEQALTKGRSVAAYIRRPHMRPAAWEAFTRAFFLVPLSRENLSGFFEVKPRPATEFAPALSPERAPDEGRIHGGSIMSLPSPEPSSVPIFLLGMEMAGDVIASERSRPAHRVELNLFKLETMETDQASYAAFLNDEWAADRLSCETNSNRQVFLWSPDGTKGIWPICAIQEEDPQCGLRFDPENSLPFHIATHTAVPMDRHPMVLVSWYGATVYCNWRSRAEGLSESYRFPENQGQPVVRIDRGGYRLPTEAEWEWIATWNGAHKRRYVWGDDWDPSRANLAESPRPDHKEAEPFTLPVDQLPPWMPEDAKPAMHHRHLAGNVWEWCEDWYSDYRDEPATHPEGPASGEIKILRGGSFRTRKESAWAAFRGIAKPDTMTADIGFRLARTAE